MCGRASLAAEQCLELIQIFGEYAAPLMAKRWNIAPTQRVRVVRQTGNGERNVDEMRWGIPPAWNPSAPPIINVRAETISKKFKDAFSNRRCLMPVSGFYEWRKEGKRRLPFHITVKNSPLYMLAAVWEPPLVTRLMQNAFAVVTTDANELVRPLHNRMPVIVPKSNWSAWKDVVATADDVMPLLRPYPADQMQVVAVSEYVNSATNEGEQCHAPAEPPERMLFDLS